MTRLLAVLLALLAAPAAATTYTLTVSTAGPGLTPSVVVSSNPKTGINCGSTNTACSMVLNPGEQATLRALAASTMAFAGWTTPGGCANNFPSCRVTLAADTEVDAAFLPLLGVALHGNGGGVVTNSTAAINCAWTGACARGAVHTYAFNPGETVVLTEVADGSSTFTGWSGYAGCAHASTCTVTVDAYTVVVATFESVGPFTLAVNVRGHGTVRSSPAGLNCGATCSAAFAGNTSVALSTLAASGYFFGGWANGGCAGRNPCVVLATSTQQGLGGRDTPTAFFYPSR